MEKNVYNNVILLEFLLVHAILIEKINKIMLNYYNIQRTCFNCNMVSFKSKQILNNWLITFDIIFDLITHD